MAGKRGRPAGQPNLKRVDGGYVNQHGVKFTAEQKKALELSVNRSNYQRKKEIASDRAKPHTVAGEVIGDTNQLRLMGKENEFIVSHQPKTLQKFKSMEEYENFMRKQDAIQSGDYALDKARAYKRNFMNSLRDTYGDEAKDIINKVRRMNPKKYIEAVGSDEVLEIRYAPSDQKTQGRLNEIRKALGMEQVDEWPDEEYE